MEYGNFEYRVVYDKSQGFCVMKLYEKKGIYYFISKMPSIPYGNSLENLKMDVDKFVDAFKKATINFDTICEL